MKRKGIIFCSLLITAIMGTSFIAQTEGRVENTTLFATKALKNNKLLLEPSDIFTIDSTNSYNLIKNETESILPNVCLFRIDNSMNIVDASGQVITSYLNAYNDVFLTKKIIPAIIIKDAEMFAKYNAFSDESLYVQDSYIVTSSLDVLSSIRLKKDNKYQNLCFDISNFDLNDQFTKENLLYFGNEMGVTTYLMNNNIANKYEFMEYFHRHFKTTWLYAKDASEMGEAIASGAYGVVNNDYKMYANVLDKFDEDGATRTQYIAAHRGITSGLYNENSTDAIQAAIDMKSDFVEIDLQITKDNKIVVCHDSFPYYTSTCDNSAFRFIKNNYDALSEFRLNDQGIEKGLKYPLLSELFELSKNSNLNYLLEFKFDDGSADAYVADVAQYVDAIVKEYKMQDRVQGITFFKGFYTSITKHMPYMPTAYIGLSTDSEYKPLNNVLGAVKFMKKYNTSVDYAVSTNAKTYAFDYAVRGYSLSSWNFSNTMHLYYPLQIATLDTIPTLKDLIRESKDESFKTIATKANFSSKMPIKWITYDGTEVTKTSTITIVEGDVETSKYLTCVASIYDKTNDYGVYSKPFTISILGNGGSETEETNYEEQTNVLVYDSTNKLVVKDKNAPIPGEDDTSSTSGDISVSNPSTGGNNVDDSNGNNLPIILGITIPIIAIGLSFIGIVIYKKKKHKQ